MRRVIPRLPRTVKASLVKTVYSRWRAPAAEPIPGYSVLIPVPGDLPFLLKIALETCARQDTERLAEIVVIPDHVTPAFSEIRNAVRELYRYLSIRFLHLRSVDRLIAGSRSSPHRTHWLQIIRGVDAVRTQHALLHDVDLFISDPSFMESHYRTCAERRLACRGVSKGWDPWYAQHGIGHLVATWELMFDVDWFRSFAPWEHRAHDGIVAGEPRTLDTTWAPQCQTPPDRIGCHTEECGLIHFNYVISTYRLFQHSTPPFEDDNFRLLLLRLLIDAYEPTGTASGVPSLRLLTNGIAHPENLVTYVQEQTARQYGVFRSKLQQLIDSGILGSERMSVIEDGVRPFDGAFGAG